MSTTFSKGSKTRITRNIRTKYYQRVTTGFCTEAGPAAGTMWIFASDKSREVWEVEPAGHRGTKLIYFVDKPFRTRTSFLEDVKSGEAILVGVEAVAMDSTAI